MKLGQFWDWHFCFVSNYIHHHWNNCQKNTFIPTFLRGKWGGQWKWSRICHVKNAFVTEFCVFIIPVYKTRLQQPLWDDLGKFHNMSPTTIFLAGQFSSYSIARHLRGPSLRVTSRWNSPTWMMFINFGCYFGLTEDRHKSGCDIAQKNICCMK